MSGGDDDLLDMDDGDMAATTLGTDLFGTQDVPAYPAIAKVGRFDILGRIARGGMAEVYLARDQNEDGSIRHVVVKRVLTEMQHDPRMLRMFLSEGHIAVRLFHPNVVHVYEVGTANNLTFMACEWVHGTSLRDAIRRAAPRGGLPIPVVVHVIARIAAALEYVHHARGVDGRPLEIVHQDVTPHNMMLSWKGQVKLLDFGIAKTSAQAATGGHMEGKYEYMSPEQVRGEPIDARSDVFALGVCLYEALTSSALYARDGLPQIMTAIVEEGVPSVRTARPDLSEALDRIVRKALAKRREERFQSAGEMQQALEQWLAKNGHTVADVRVALAIGNLFSPAEKSPLPPGAANITGTLAAMGMEAATVAMPAYEEAPPSAIKPVAMPDPAPSAGSARAGAKEALVIVVAGGLILAVATLGIAVAYLLLRS